MRQTTSLSFTKLIGILCTALVKGGARQQWWQTGDQQSAPLTTAATDTDRETARGSSSNNTKATAHIIVLCGLVWAYAHKTILPPSTDLESKQSPLLPCYSIVNRVKQIKYHFVRGSLEIFMMFHSNSVLWLHISGRRGRSLHHSLHLPHYGWYNWYILLKGIVYKKKMKFCQHLIILMSFQTCMLFFNLWNTKGNHHEFTKDNSYFLWNVPHP